jgi:hypothetical protein
MIIGHIVKNVLEHYISITPTITIMAAVSQFAGQSLVAEAGGFEPQRASQFAILIPQVDDSGGTLVLSLADANIPEVAITTGSIKYFNETMKYAGSVTPFADQTIHFNDYIDRATLTILSQWMAQVINFQTGAIGWASDYKKTGSILLLPPSIENASAPGAVMSTPYGDRVWNLTGIFPKKLKHAETLSMSDDGAKPVMIELLLSVDRCYPSAMVGQ